MVIYKLASPLQWKQCCHCLGHRSLTIEKMLRCLLPLDHFPNNTWTCVDDLTQAVGLVEKIMVLFDGKTVESGGEMFKPRTSFMTALNMSCFKLLVKHHRYLFIS